MDVRFGSFLALHSDNTRTAALERLAVVRYGFCGSQLANVRFSPKRTFRCPKIHKIEGPLSDTSGLSQYELLAQDSRHHPADSLVCRRVLTQAETE